MPKPVRGDGAEGNANGVQRESNVTPAGADDFRAQVHGLLERALRAHKAETIAAAVDRKRSTIYRWAAEPDDVPLAVLPALAAFDPDPEVLPRIAGMLLAVHAARALRREAQGRALTVFFEYAPGRVGR